MSAAVETLRRQLNQPDTEYNQIILAMREVMLDVSSQIAGLEAGVGHLTQEFESIAQFFVDVEEGPE